MFAGAASLIILPVYSALPSELQTRIFEVSEALRNLLWSGIDELIMIRLPECRWCPIS